MPLLRANFGELDYLQGQLNQSVAEFGQVMDSWMAEAAKLKADWPDSAGFTFEELEMEHRQIEQLNRQMQAQCGAGVGNANAACQNAVASAVGRMGG